MNLSFETILGILFFIVFFVLPAFSKKRPRDDEQAQKPPEGAGDGQAPGRPVAPRTRQAPQTNQAPQGQGRPQASSSQPAQQAPRTRPATSRADGPLTGGSIEEALDEIRARVREAQEQEDVRRGDRARTSGRRPTATASTSGQARSGGSTSSGGSLVSGEPRRMRDAGTAQPATPARASQAPTAGQRSGPAQAQRPAAPTRGSFGTEGVAAPLQVERKRRQAGSTSEYQVTGGAAAARRHDATLRQDGAAAARLGAPGLATDRAALVTGMMWREILSEPAAKRRLRRTRSRHL